MLLQELYKQLGTNEVLFLFTDAHVVDEGFLEYLNNMLTTGTYLLREITFSKSKFYQF